MNFIHRSSTSELADLAKKIGLTDLVIIKKSDFNKFKKHENIILNLDDNGAGSHWIGCNTKKKIYFDSYNQLPPKIIPKNYKSIEHNFELQTIDAEDCGQLTVLALYYIKNGKGEDFYKLFKDVYT